MVVRDAGRAILDPRTLGALLELVAIAALGGGSQTAVALDPRKATTQYVHDAWQTDDGLPQNSVRALTQTRNGYLWLGTEEGLVRFDGVAFTVFDRSNTEGLASSAVLALHESRDGSLWIGTYSGGLIRYREGRFTPYGAKEGLSRAIVWALGEDREGSLWIGTDGAGLSRLSQGHFTRYGVKEGLPSERVTSIYEDAKAGLWVGTVAGLCRRTNGAFVTFTKKDGLPGDEVTALRADRRGALWIGTRGAGVARFREGRIEVPAEMAALSRSVVRCLFEDRDGNLWIGTTGNGLYRYSGGRLDGYSTKDGLSNENVVSICEDREGNLWVGTDGGGLNRLKDGKLTAFTVREGLSNDMVWCIEQGRSGAVWIGTFGGGLNRLKDGTVTVLTAKEGLSDDRVWSVHEDQQGDLWIGTFSGLDRLSSHDGTLRRFTTRDGLSSNNVMSIAEDHEGTLWLGTFGGGLTRLKDGRFTTYGKREGLSNPNVIFVHEDRKGRLWVGTFGGGLHQLEEGRFTSYTTREGLSSDMLTSMYEDADGTLWIGTLGGGINRFRDGRFVAYTKKVGLFDDVAYHILEDGKGRLWMGSNKGIFRASRKELNDFAEGRVKAVHSVAFGKADGMRSVEVNSGAGTRTADGRLWFPTIRGAVSVDPEHLKTNEIPPPVVIERLVADDRTVPGPRHELAPGTERLEIHYTALSLVAPEKVAFQYRLEGVDTGWVSAGARRVAYYTRVPPGRHQFRVIASNEDGVFSPSGASIEIDVLPLFHQTIGFYILCLLGGAAAVMTGYHMRVRRLKRREVELLTLVEERTVALRQSHLTLEKRSEELEVANRALQQLSYRDALTGIANRRYFEEMLESEERRAFRQEGTLSLIMVDIDFFKSFNDAYGHQAGDECLRRVAAALRAGVSRGGDLVARYGGEEFVIVLPETAEEGALALAELLRRRIEELSMPHKSSTVAEVVTISLGLATARPRSPVSNSSLVAAADRALYLAKQEGRNRVVVSEVAAT